MGINLRRTFGHFDSLDILMGKFTRAKQDQESPFSLQIARDLISLNVHPDERHWWSPEMTLRFEKGDNQTIVHEVIGPNSSMFTLAMFFIMLGAVVFLAALMMSLSQYSVGELPLLALTATFLSGLLIAATFIGLAIGRMKAAFQVIQLRDYIGGIIGGHTFSN